MKMIIAVITFALSCILYAGTPTVFPVPPLKPATPTPTATPGERNDRCHHERTIVANGVVLVGSDLFFHDAPVNILGATLRLDAPGLDYAATARRAPA
jgi:hypothetical protein